MRTAGGLAHEPWRSCAGFCGLDVVDQPSGVLTAGEGRALRRLAEEVKLGRDLITEFADRYEPFPGRLAWSQVRELLAVRTLLDRYGLSDPTVGLAPGGFTEVAVRARYDGLRAAGRRDRAAALAAVAAHACDVIALLGRDLAATTAPDVRHTCLHVLAAAHQQLRVVQAWSSR
ncbi:hypothetical protein EV385_5117 [Krasilnikovia cinnamomea]|uniref:DUF2202 domain-containing protein n=2 Tax=Krasilnikovia cinnamomea TaxID=349313 RepID=A0A4Q7ZRZ5_9ACTN|nr:hypothetical protein EV385_5117 [Krasilnikovia cinnamomea]